jgi:hypothetical protein
MVNSGNPDFFYPAIISGIINPLEATMSKDKLKPPDGRTRDKNRQQKERQKGKYVDVKRPTNTRIRRISRHR